MSEHIHDENCKTVMKIRNTDVDSGTEIFTAAIRSAALHADTKPRVPIKRNEDGTWTLYPSKDAMEYSPWTESDLKMLGAAIRSAEDRVKAEVLRKYTRMRPYTYTWANVHREMEAELAALTHTGDSHE